MKRIDKWVARDNSEWATEQDAHNREVLLDKIADIEFYFPEGIHDTNFSNGHGYIQHTKSKIKVARDGLLKLAEEYVGSFMSSYDLKSYAFGRYLNDSTRYYPIYNLYYRIVSCLDDNTWREYGQPYYTFHTDEVEQICLNGEE
jgi:hypothetical protein